MAKADTTRFGAADYLNTAEHVVAYLDAYLEDGSPEEIRAALDTAVRSRGISELAERTDMSRVGLSKAVGANGDPSFETVRSVLHALGLRLTSKLWSRASRVPILFFVRSLSLNS